MPAFLISAFKQVGTLSLWMCFLLVPLIFLFKILSWFNVSNPLIYHYMVALLTVSLSVVFPAYLAPGIYQEFSDKYNFGGGSWGTCIFHGLILLIFTVAIIATGIGFFMKPQVIPF